MFQVTVEHIIKYGNIWIVFFSSKDVLMRVVAQGLHPETTTLDKVRCANIHCAFYGYRFEWKGEGLENEKVLFNFTSAIICLFVILAAVIILN